MAKPYQDACANDWQIAAGQDKTEQNQILDVVDDSAREDEFHSVGEKVLRLSGAWDNPNPRLELLELSAHGCGQGTTRTLDIYPTVKRLTAKVGRAARVTDILFHRRDQPSPS